MGGELWWDTHASQALFKMDLFAFVVSEVS